MRQFSFQAQFKLFKFQKENWKSLFQKPKYLLFLYSLGYRSNFTLNPSN